MILGERLVPAEAEQTVKTYHCTSFKSRLLGIVAEGYLEVTNKRVVFQATGGNSLIHSEVPIEEVSGISLFKGNYFSFMHFLAAFLLAILLGGLLTTILSAVFGLIGSWDAMAVMSWLVAIGAGAASFAVARDKIWRAVLAGTSATAFASIGGASFLGGLFGGGAGSALALPLALIVGIYALVCAVWYAIRKTMSLAISAKGGSNTPIAIAGAGGGSALYSGAARALEAEPAGDAEAVMKELGALIMDIQQRGDFGIDKWRAGQPA